MFGALIYTIAHSVDRHDSELTRCLPARPTLARQGYCGRDYHGTRTREIVARHFANWSDYPGGVKDVKSIQRSPHRPPRWNRVVDEASA